MVLWSWEAAEMMGMGKVPWNGSLRSGARSLASPCTSSMMHEAHGAWWYCHQAAYSPLQETDGQDSSRAKHDRNPLRFVENMNM